MASKTSSDSGHKSEEGGPIVIDKLALISLTYIAISRFIFHAHPVFISGALAVSALWVGVAAAFILGSWFFYITTLVFLGGVIVLIIYITTLCTNEQLSYRRGGVAGVGLVCAIIWGVRPTSIGRLIGKSSVIPASVFSSFHITLLVFLLRFLFIVIISVVKLVKVESGPLSSRL